MVKRAAPPAVFLWAQLEYKTLIRKFFNADLPVVRPAPRVIVGGPGMGSLNHVH